MSKYGILFSAFISIVFCHFSFAAQPSAPIEMLNAENILNDIYGVSVIKNDSAYHVQKKDAYVGRCSAPHVHRYALRNADTLLFKDSYLQNDTAYSRLLSILPISNDSALAVFESTRPFFNTKTDPASIDIALYVFRNAAWSRLFQQSIVAAGGFGFVGNNSVAYVNLGASHPAVIIKSFSIVNQCIYTYSTFFAFEHNHFSKVMTLCTGYDNSMLTVDDEDMVPDYCYEGYYADNTTYTTVKGKNPEWYDITTKTKGACHYDKVIHAVDSSDVYVFVGKEYVHANSPASQATKNDAAADTKAGELLFKASSIPVTRISAQKKKR